METVDAIVVGAGPAGSAAALALRRRPVPLRVVLLDRDSFPRDKACGDAIAWHAFAELAALGVTDIATDAPPVSELRLRGPRGTEVVGDTGRANRVIPRKVFDARLVAHAVRSGATFRQHRVRTVRQDATGVVVDDRWRSPWLIAADGATSVVRRQLGVPPATGRHRAIAIRAYTADREPDQTYQRIDMRSTAWPSYAWSFPLPGGGANVGYGMRTSATGPGTRDLLHRVAAEIAVGPVTDARVHPLPLSTGRPRPDHGRVLLTGDAASLINPLSGEGIFYAIASGRLAAEAVAAAGPGGAAGVRYRRALQRRFARHFATTSVLARLLDVEGLAPVVIRAVRDPGAFADLAEIGLGEGRMTRRLAAAIVRALATRG